MKFIIESAGFRFIFSHWDSLSEELQNIFSFLIHFGSMELVRDNVIYRVER